MLTIAKTAPDRIDIELSGTLNAETMRRALEDLLAKSEGITQGKMFYRIRDFEWPTLGALAVEFRLMPQLLGMVGRFDKCAVLCDAAWIRTVAQIEGAVIPGLEIKSFLLTDDAAAESWLAGSDSDADADEEEDENFPV